MWRRSALALFLTATATASFPQPVAPRKEIKLRLNFGTPLKRKYLVHRVWNSTPKGSGNGHQVHDLTVQLAVKPLPSGSYRFETSILRFSGKDLVGSETKHLKEIAPEVQKDRLGRIFTGLGPTGAWEPLSASSSGLAGMMAYKALGLYEIGFLDTVYSEKPVHIGSNWFRDWKFGNEWIYGSGGKSNSAIHGIRGNAVRCSYTLKGLDQVKRTATISFVGAAVITMRYVDPVGKGKSRVQIDEKQSGKWVVDLKTGLPLSFHSDRTTISIFGYRVTNETAITDVALAK